MSRESRNMGRGAGVSKPHVSILCHVQCQTALIVCVVFYASSLVSWP